MKISKKHIVLFLASRFGNQAVNATLTDEAMGPYDDKAAVQDETAAPYITDTDELMGLKDGHAIWNTTMGKSVEGKGTGWLEEPETPKPTTNPTSKPPPTPPMTEKGKSGSKSGAKYGNGYEHDYQYGYNEGYMKNTMKPTPSPAPPCPYLIKVRHITKEASTNVINDISGNASIFTFGLYPIFDEMNLTKQVATAYGSCFIAPSSQNSDKQEYICEETYEFSSKNSLSFKYKFQYCPGGNATVGLNAVVVAGTGCLCGTEGSTIKVATVSTAIDYEYSTIDLSTLSNSCGDGGWSDMELKQLSCPT